MPIYNLKCLKCWETKRLLSSEPFDKIPVTDLICKCNYIMVRAFSGPQSTLVKETLDNGAMRHAVERPADIERIMRERIAKADPLAGTNKNYS